MFNNLHELIAKMPDDKACREYYENERWHGKPECPYCGCDKSYKLKNGKQYKCANDKCYRVYSVLVGTIFEGSKIPLNKWFMALYLASAHKKGISSVQLSKDIGCTQKTAWFMLHRIREGMRERGARQLRGVIEFDETYMSRKFGSEYKAIPPEKVAELDKLPKKKINKGVVAAMKQRGGDIIVVAVSEGTKKELQPHIDKHIAANHKVMTDEALKYKSFFKNYWLQSVNHSAGEWVRGDVHTNGVENFWSVMKRGVYGIYHQISFKHLQAYCNEYSYRYNWRKMGDAQRFIMTLRNTDGRLKYKDLIKK